LAAILAMACNTSTPTDPTPTSTVSYTAIGASDGSGFGGSVVCAPFDPDCPNGTGYVYLLKRRLQRDGRTVSLQNLAVPGAVMSPAVQTLAREIGRDILSTFFDQSTVVLPATTHLTVFAGGNDANVIAESIRAGRAGADVRGFIDAQVNQWQNDLHELVRRIRQRAPDARVVALNLPNLGAAPYVAGLPVLERSILQRITVMLTDRINALNSQSVLVIDLMCEPRAYDPSRFSSDGFHPSDSGYALMAELAYPALANNSAPSPSSTCPQRTLLPVF
jgi:lysophospholipase L1-like esterase